MKKIMMALCFAGCLNAVHAEDLHYNVLEFNESASVSVPNDTMNVFLRVEANGKSRTEVANIVSRRVNAVLNRTKGNSQFDVQSGNRSAYPQYNDKRQIVGWTDTADIRINSMDFDALSKLVADSQNDAALEGVSFSVSPNKHAQAVEEASQKALQSFQQRARSMSQTLGFSGNYKIVKLQLNQSFEMDNADGMDVAMAAMMYSAKSSRNAVEMQTSAGTRKIRQNVQATVQMQ